MSLAALALGLLAHAQEAPPRAGSGESWALLQGLHASGRLEIEAPPGPTERAARRLEGVVRAAGFEVVTNPETHDARAVRVLCAGPDDARLAALLAPCGVEMLPDGFRLAGREYRSSGDALRAVFEDPEQRGRPLCLFLGNDLETLGVFLTEIPRLSRPALFVWADGDPALEGSLTLAGAPGDDWIDYLAVRERLFAGREPEELQGLALIGPELPRGRRTAYLRSLFGVCKRVVGWLDRPPPRTPPQGADAPGDAAPEKAPKEELGEELGEEPEDSDPAPAPAGPPDSGPEAVPAGSGDRLEPEATPDDAPLEAPETPETPDPIKTAGASDDTSEPGPRVELYVYTHLEDFRAALGTSALALVNRLHPRVHVLLAPGVPDDDGRAVAYALARAIAGEPARPWLRDALAVAAAGRWWGVPLTQWCGRLAAAGPFPPLQALLGDRASEQLDPHVLAPARGLAFSLLAGTSRSGRLLRALWNGAGLPPPAASALQVGAKLAARAFAADRSRGNGAAQALAGAPAGRGLALFAPAGGDLGGRGVGPALDEALALESGFDAVSLTVYASDREPAPPLARLESGRVFGSASDVELASAVAAAHLRGLRVFLTLEPLAGPQGAWADVRAYNGLDAQAEFFTRYQALVRHYALLCQVLGVEVFALGADLRESSRTAPQSEVLDERLFVARRAGWKRVIAGARSAFDGALTYVARFPSEAGEIAFWDQLDFLSIAFFPQLAQRGNTPDADQVRRLVRLGLRDALDLSVVWNKPLVLAQVGFPARAASWSWPAAPAGAEDPGAQRLYLEALASVLEGPLEDRDALRGLFLWSWPVNEEPLPGGAVARDFFLRGRGLEDVLVRLLAR